MAQADLFVLLDQVQFERRNYQNRTMIRMNDEVFQVSLALRNLFEHPTVASLATIIDGLWSLAQADTLSRTAGDREEIVL
jgi:hypothetical protein